MTQHVSIYQVQSKLREIARRQQQAIDQYNREVQRKRQQAIDKYNEGVRRYSQAVNQAITNYNQAVREHNARVRANQQRLRNELERLKRQPVTTRYVVFRTSVTTLNEAYVRLERHAENHLDARYNHLLDLSEQEAANNLGVINSLLDGGEGSGQTDTLAETTIKDELRIISRDLDSRWRGAVFALSPRNPDAARHFCTSAREVMSTMLEVKAPDREVINLMPTCERTEKGNPTRRSKVKYLLYKKGMTDSVFEDFVEQDIENVVQLFRVFNDGTHGSAGKFNLPQLFSIKKRVEDGIKFLSEIAN